MSSAKVTIQKKIHPIPGTTRARFSYTVLQDGVKVESYLWRDSAVEAARQLRVRLKRGGAHNDNSRARNRSGAPAWHMPPERLADFRGAVLAAKARTVAKKHVPVVREVGLHEGTFGAWASDWGTRWFTINVYERQGSRVQLVGRYRTMATGQGVAEKYTVAQHLIQRRIPMSHVKQYDAITFPE